MHFFIHGCEVRSVFKITFGLLRRSEFRDYQEIFQDIIIFFLILILFYKSKQRAYLIWVTLIFTNNHREKNAGDGRKTRTIKMI